MIGPKVLTFFTTFSRIFNIRIGVVWCCLNNSLPGAIQLHPVKPQIVTT